MLTVQTFVEPLLQQLLALEKSLKELEKDRSSSVVHSARVASRRAETAVFLFQDALRPRDFRFFTRRCKLIRSLSNRARNCDVLLATHASQEDGGRTVKKITKRGQRSRQRLVHTIEKWLTKDQFTKHRLSIGQWVSADAPRFVGVRLLQLGGQYVSAATNGPIGDSNVHRLRIAIKHLRYAFEFLVKCGCTANVSDVLETLEQLQIGLGARTDALMHQRLLPNSGDCVRSFSWAYDTSRTLAEVNQIFMKVAEVAQWCCRTWPSSAVKAEAPDRKNNKFDRLATEHL